MQSALNTSFKGDAFVPQERAVLPVSLDLATEIASWIDQEVSLMIPGYQGSRHVSGMLRALVKGLNGDMLLKVECDGVWTRTNEGGSHEVIPSIHLIPFSKIYQISRGDNSGE